MGEESLFCSNPASATCRVETISKAIYRGALPQSVCAMWTAIRPRPAASLPSTIPPHLDHMPCQLTALSHNCGAELLCLLILLMRRRRRRSTSTTAARASSWASSRRRCLPSSSSPSSTSSCACEAMPPARWRGGNGGGRCLRQSGRHGGLPRNHQPAEPAITVSPLLRGRDTTLSSLSNSVVKPPAAAAAPLLPAACGTARYEDFERGIAGEVSMVVDSCICAL